MSIDVRTGKYVEPKLNSYELAWAAGFFDGEGSCYIYNRNDRYNPQLTVAVGQMHKYVLFRFKRAILDLGNITKKKTGFYEFKVQNFHHSQAVMTLLWKYLSPVKRKQFKKCLEEYHATWIGGTKFLRGKYRKEELLQFRQLRAEKLKEYEQRCRGITA